MGTEEHVEVVDQGHFDKHALWGPVVGAETSRLLDASGLDETSQGRVIRQAVQILGRCSPPTASGSPRTGLAIGYVQSGKTLSFTTLIGLARDNGFPLIILLAGTKANLHEQTASRLSRDLAVERSGGLSPWYMIANPSPHSGKGQAVASYIKGMQDPATPDRFRRATVLTVMKNHTRLAHLRNFIAELTDFGIDFTKTPVLIVDDEADQAGLNAAADKEDPTATYRGIVAVRDALPSHSYVMYTATPQAPLLVNLADTLSPDFVIVLEAGDEYTGGEYFFGTQKHTFVKRLSDADVREALDPGLLAPPDALQLSLATYFLILAHLGHGPVSMLVHPSHTTDLHGKYAQFVRSLKSSWEQILKAPEDDPDRRELTESWFLPAYQDLTREASLIPLHDLLREMPFWIGATHVRVVNSGTPADADISWDAAPSWILVGGNKLDRGFTVEGLVVTYMPRRLGAGQVDSVQQRARFFGYKRAYGPLCRAWLSPGTADALEHYVDHERVLRSELAHVSEEGGSLKAWTRHMLLDAKYKPTRKAVIDLPILHAGVSPERWVSIDRLMAAGVSGNANLRLVQALMDQVGGWDTDPRDRRAAADKHKRAAMLVSDVLRRILVDWRATPEERSRLNLISLLLQAQLDKEPNLMADVYLMDSLRPRRRSVDGAGSVTLQQGRSPDGTYQGDQRFFTEDRLSIQIHLIEPHREGHVLTDPMPGLALRIPARLAGGILIQKEAK